MATKTKKSKASQAASDMRVIIKDYNFWGESESDSPLKISSSKGSLDEKKILAKDASLRRSAKIEVPETRKVKTMSLDDVFGKLAKNAITELSKAAKDIKNSGIDALTKPAQGVEFYLQLYSGFKALQKTKVVYVSATGESQVGMMIIGEIGGETVIAATLLTQT